MSIKRRLLRWFIKNRKKRVNITIREEQVINIVKLLLQDNTTDLYFAPIDNTRYIKTQDSLIFVIIHADSVVISNHNYFYDVSISTDAYDELYSYYDRVTNMRRRLMEKDMLNNVSAGLNRIVEELQSNIKKEK